MQRASKMLCREGWPKCTFYLVNNSFICMHAFASVVIHVVQSATSSHARGCLITRVNATSLFTLSGPALVIVKISIMTRIAKGRHSVMTSRETRVNWHPDIIDTSCYLLLKLSLYSFLLCFLFLLCLPCLLLLLSARLLFRFLLFLGQHLVL